LGSDTASQGSMPAMPTDPPVFRVRVVALAVDTGPLVAAANLDDPDHHACRWLLESTAEQFVVPGPIVSETGFMTCQILRVDGQADLDLAVSPGIPSSRVLPWLHAPFEPGQAVSHHDHSPCGTAPRGRVWSGLPHVVGSARHQWLASRARRGMRTWASGVPQPVTGSQPSPAW
jgi:hypothetical protein